MKVLILDRTHEILQAEFEQAGIICDAFKGQSHDDLMAVLPDYDGLIARGKMRITREILAAGKRLKFIGRPGSGMEIIDVTAAREMDIACINSPEGNRESVGEHALGMLLCLLNRIHLADRQIRQGIWNRHGNWGKELMGKTIGIIGYGNTGGAFARKLKGFDVWTLAYDKYKSGFSDNYVEACDLERIFGDADILSLHVPLTEETRGMVDNEFLARFNKDILLINTSRGAVIHTPDVVMAIRSGKITGAALDVLVYEEEPGGFEHAFKQKGQEDLDFLLHSDRVILTPHVAGWTEESDYKIAKVLVDKILAFLKNSADGKL
ncbi:MAG: hypothetical protein FJY10_07060 [Bacteroidetes bacterium]|nr:hypothetical protein [Bacteroidota bacterium]